MKFIIFAGTPGSGKTSIIKYIIQELKNDFKLFFAKFDCLKTLDDERIAKEYGIPTVKKLAGELCHDHYTALEIPKIIKELLPETKYEVLKEITDKRTYNVSFEKIAKHGFKLTIPMKEGIKEIIAEFQKGAYENTEDKKYYNVEPVR